MFVTVVHVPVRASIASLVVALTVEVRYSILETPLPASSAVMVTVSVLLKNRPKVIVFKTVLNVFSSILISAAGFVWSRIFHSFSTLPV